MSEEIPEGFEKSVLAPEQSARCANQDEAAKRVREQLERMQGRLEAKSIIPVFAFEIYVINCDKHGALSHHIDMVTTGTGAVTPTALPHVIHAVEVLLKDLKARLT